MTSLLRRVFFAPKPDSIPPSERPEAIRARRIAELQALLTEIASPESKTAHLAERALEKTSPHKELCCA
jgi:hypothetical protein